MAADAAKAGDPTGIEFDGYSFELKRYFLIIRSIYTVLYTEITDLLRFLCLSGPSRNDSCVQPRVALDSITMPKSAHANIAVIRRKSEVRQNTTFINL